MFTVDTCIQRMTLTLPSQKKFKYLHKALLVFLLQIFIPGSLADLVVKEKDYADLQLDQVLTQAELVEDTTLPLECRRQVYNSRMAPSVPPGDTQSIQSIAIIAYRVVHPCKMCTTFFVGLPLLVGDGERKTCERECLSGDSPHSTHSDGWR